MMTMDPPEKVQRGLVLSRLKEHRLNRTLTQTQLADLAGVTKPTIWAAEHGRPVALATVRKLALALMVPVEELR